MGKIGIWNKGYGLVNGITSVLIYWFWSLSYGYITLGEVEQSVCGNSIFDFYNFSVILNNFRERERNILQQTRSVSQLQIWLESSNVCLSTRTKDLLCPNETLDSKLQIGVGRSQFNDINYVCLVPYLGEMRLPSPWPNNTTRGLSDWKNLHPLKNPLEPAMGRRCAQAHSHFLITYESQMSFVKALWYLSSEMHGFFFS